GRGNAEIQTPVREMIEHRDAVGEFGRMMIWQQKSTPPAAETFGLHSRLRPQQIRRRVRLPWRGVMLADPRLGVAELVEPAQHLKVPVMPLLQSALRRRGRHPDISSLP